jgi:hypothetical protein
MIDDVNPGQLEKWKAFALSVGAVGFLVIDHAYADAPGAWNIFPNDVLRRKIQELVDLRWTILRLYEFNKGEWTDRPPPNLPPKERVQRRTHVDDYEIYRVIVALGTTDAEQVLLGASVVRSLFGIRALVELKEIGSAAITRYGRKFVEPILSHAPESSR